MDSIKKSVKRDIDRKGEDGLRLPERRGQRAEAAAARIVSAERDRALLATEDRVIQSGKVRAIQQNADGEVETVGYETRRHDRSFANRNALDMPKLLDMGYAYRPHDDGQIEFWNPNDSSDDADEIKALRGRQGLIDAGVLADDGGATAQRLSGEVDFAAQHKKRAQRTTAAFDQRLAATQAANGARPPAAHASHTIAGPQPAAPAAPPSTQPEAAERAEATAAPPAHERISTAPQDAIPSLPPHLATRRRIAYRGFQHDAAQPAAVREHLDGTIQAVPARVADEIPPTAAYAAIGTDVAPLLAAGATVQPAPDGEGIVSWTEPPADPQEHAQQQDLAEQRLQRLEAAIAQVRAQSYDRAAAQIRAGDRAAANRTVAQAQRRLASLTARSQRVQAQLTQTRTTVPQPPKVSE